MPVKRKASNAAPGLPLRSSASSSGQKIPATDQRPSKVWSLGFRAMWICKLIIIVETKVAGPGS